MLCFTVELEKLNEIQKMAVEKHGIPIIHGHDVILRTWRIHSRWLGGDKKLTKWKIHKQNQITEKF